MLKVMLWEYESYTSVKLVRLDCWKELPYADDCNVCCDVGVLHYWGGEWCFVLI